MWDHDLWKWYPGQDTKDCGFTLLALLPIFVQYSLLCLLCFHDLIFDLITIAVTVCCIECKLEESKKTQSAYCSENETREKEYDEDNFDNGEEKVHEEY